MKDNDTIEVSLNSAEAGLIAGLLLTADLSDENMEIASGICNKMLPAIRNRMNIQ